MLLAVDTYYFENKAKTVGLAFDDWEATAERHRYVETLEHVAEYVSGEFYKRELPCILSLMATYKLGAFEAIIVDGFVYLDDDGKMGLGGHLYKALGKTIPVIGVAKTDFISLKTNKKALLRGNSSKPLFITAIGVDLDLATEKIKIMNGDFRMPALLKKLDVLTKSP